MSRQPWPTSSPLDCCGWASTLDLILWQFPSNFRFERARLEAFLRLLPHDTVGAALVGRKHDATLPTPPWLKVESVRPLRHAFEVRHESFRCVEFIELLRAHGVALVCADTAKMAKPDGRHLGLCLLPPRTDRPEARSQAMTTTH